jgi:hypothetical protein
MGMVRSLALDQVTFDAIHKIVGRTIGFCADSTLEKVTDTIESFISKLKLQYLERCALDLLLTGSVERKTGAGGESSYLFHCYPVRRNFDEFSAMSFHPFHFLTAEIRILSDYCACRILEHFIGQKLSDGRMLVDILQVNQNAAEWQIFIEQLLENLFHFVVQQLDREMLIDRRKFVLHIAAKIPSSGD